MSGNIKIKKIASKDKSVLQNLFQLYMHDTTDALEMDVNQHGFFEYNYLDTYFMEDKDSHAYFIYVNEKLAGFVLVSNDFSVLDDGISNKYNLSDVFVLNKYKWHGVGENVVKQVFEKHKGSWEVSLISKYQTAKSFCLKVVGDYTKNNFKEHYLNQDKLVLTFENN